MNRRKAITWTLAALLALLLWDFTDRALLYTPLQGQSVGARDSAEEAPEDPNKYEAAWGPEIAARNLFSESRSERPSATDSALGMDEMPGPGTAAPVPSVRPEIKLSGIIQNQLGEDVAFLQVGSQDPVGARKGETVEGFKVVDIDRRAVSLEWLGSTFELTLSSNPLIKR